MTFYSKEELDEHVLEHEKAAKIFKCEKCKLSFITQEELEKHMMDIHGK